MSSENAFTAEPILRPRMPELDSIRGIAILAVMLFHGFDPVVAAGGDHPAWQRAVLAISGQGWAGVNLFFVLSGFLITGILLDSAHRPGYYSRFYSRRILRIFPAYYLLLLLLVVWCYLTAVPQRTIWGFVGISSIYLSNLAGLFGIYILYPLLWSLSVEEHFYLVWPAVVRMFSRRGVAIVAIAVCLIEPALRLYALSAGTDPWWAGIHRGGNYRYTWMVADGLALGALLALFARSAWGKRENFLRIALGIVILADVLTVLSKYFSRPMALCLAGTLINYYSLAIVAGILWLGTGEYRRWANLRGLAFYGYISYGLYLIHGLIYVMYRTLAGRIAPSIADDSQFGNACLAVAICVPIATGIAYLSRVTYEEYFLRLKDKNAKSAETRRTAAVA